MCFYVNANNPKALIAEKDIRVYKFLKEIHYNPQEEVIHGKSPYVFYWWTANKVEKAIFNILKATCGIGIGEINQGLHAFLNLEKCRTMQSKWSHLREKGVCICECFIPKGSEYYINKDREEIVSNQMIWSGRVYSHSSKRWKEIKK